MKLATKTLLTCTAAAIIGTSANAAVIVDSSTDFALNPGNVTPFTVLSTDAVFDSFTVGTSDKLIVAFAGRQSVATTVTYGGVSLDLAEGQIGNSNNDGSGHIFYLDNPTVDGDFVITGGHNSSHVSFYAVSGLADGGPVQTDSYALDSGDDSSGVELSLTTGVGGGFVVASGGTSANGIIPTVTDGTYSTEFGRGGNAAWIDAGSSTYEFDVSADRSAGVMVEFAAVPEPGSLALLGLGGLLIARRRRTA
jgi:hypothetical protein